MNAEIISLETAKEIETLKKENGELTEIITKFDRAVNKQYNLIKKILEYCKNTNMTVAEYKKLEEMIEKENQ